MRISDWSSDVCSSDLLLVNESIERLSIPARPLISYLLEERRCSSKFRPSHEDAPPLAALLDEIERLLHLPAGVLEHHLHSFLWKIPICFQNTVKHVSRCATAAETHLHVSFRQSVVFEIAHRHSDRKSTRL